MLEEIVKQKDDSVNGSSRELIELETKVTSFVINNDEDFFNAGEMLKIIKNKVKTIEGARKRITKPLNDYIKSWNGEFKTVLDRANDVKDKIEKEVLRYNKIKEQQKREDEEIKRQEELKRLEEEREISELKAELLDSKAEEKKSEYLEKKITKLEDKEIQIKPSYDLGDSKLTIRKSWTYEVVDENLVPRDFCSPDHKKIMDDIKSGTREIPGLNIYQKETTMSR